MPPHLGYGDLSYDVAHLLDTAALVLSFVLLYQRRLYALINAYAAQALVLAAAAAWQGVVRGGADLFVTALLTLVAKGVAIPLALHTIVRRLQMHRSVEVALGIFPSLILGVALVALAILVVLPVTRMSGTLTREDLALALSVVLLGLLMMITRRTALTQTIGFLSMENGLMLAAVGMTGMPLVMEFSSAFLVMLAFIVFGLFLFRIRERFDSLDVHHLDRVGGGVER
ncbi:MAG TPA: hydrogenase-4 component E [Acetobacteraceae bacterium]|nr:hydrogenase-4 component E [Acetobacteraceae bacterium]